MKKEAFIKKYVSGGYKPEEDGSIVSFLVPGGEIEAVCKKLYVDEQLELKTIFATDERQSGTGYRVRYVFAAPEKGLFIVPYIFLKNTEEFASITNTIHEANLYERKIRTFFGLIPVGHPDPRPLLLHENWPENMFPLRKDFVSSTRPARVQGSYPFLKVEGEGIYEIPVGPVHAGIIEPGYFRFSVAGEEIVRLEAKLGYVHKGIEKLFETLPIEKKVKLSERVSGDTSFTHSLAFCQALEELSGIEVPDRAKYLRVIFSELERLSNHLNDIGFIMLDTGYSFGGANGTRLREVVMRLHERVSGNRFLRGVNVIGGVTKDIDVGMKTELSKALASLDEDFKEIITIAAESSSVQNRLEGTGVLLKQVALDHGVVGIAAKASGIFRDSRVQYPYAAYDKLAFSIATETAGDVQARFTVRVKEVSSSLALIREALANIPSGKIITEMTKNELRKNSCAVGIAEGWRGEVVYAVATDAEGAIERVEVRDPSFLNWSAVGYAVKGNVVPDFPLINKSFNLSYSGNDL